MRAASNYEQIRKVHEREGLAVRALARRFRVHRRDVRRALASAVPQPRKVAVRAAPKLDPWKPLITRSRGGLAKSTVRDGCGVLKVFLRYAYRQGVLAADLSRTVEWPRSIGSPRSRGRSLITPT